MNRHCVEIALCAIVVGTLGSVAGCSKSETVAGPDQIVGSGRLIAQTRTIGSFNGIRVTNFASVIITQDTVQSLTIEADDNIMDRVSTSLIDGELVVGVTDGSYRNATVNVHATMANIRRLESTGAADFSTTGPIRTDSIDCSITGAGTVTLNGSAAYESVEIVGAGTVHNGGLVAAACSVSISGTGNVEVDVLQELDALIAGTGTITYSGNPPIVRQTITGVGTVRPGS